MTTAKLVLVSFLCLMLLIAIVMLDAKSTRTTESDETGWVKSPIADAKLAASTLARGRTIGALVANDEAHALFLQFDAQMAMAVPEASVASVLQSNSAGGPIGNRLSDRAGSGDQGATLYTALFAHGAGKLRINIAFDQHGKVAGMLVRPD
jgi:hypothetical protein